MRFSGKFYRLYRTYILKGDDICLSSDFFQSKLCFAYLNSRLIRPNQLETTFTDEKSTGECLKYNIFEYIFPIFFRGSMVLEVTWQKAGGQSGFKLQLSLVFYPVVVSFFPFFISWYHMFSFVFSFFLIPWYVFPLLPLLALYLSFTKFVISIFLSY